MSEKIKVLFAKKISFPIPSFDANGIEYESLDFIKTKPTKPKNFNKKKTNDTIHHIITSKNALYFVEELKPNGYFYCVGKKLSELLQKKGFVVEYTANNADEICQMVEKSKIQNWNYFCGNKRLDTIPDFFLSVGKDLNEVVCYETFLETKKLKIDYDAYVFFSPSGVESFFLENSIPKKGKIFALGKSTAKKIEDYGVNCSFVPDSPDLISIIQKINNCYA